EERREHPVDLVLHAALELVPGEAPAEFGLDVADEFRADLDAAQGAQFGAEPLGGTFVPDRRTAAEGPGPGSGGDQLPEYPPRSALAADGLDDRADKVDKDRDEAAADGGHVSPHRQVVFPRWQGRRVLLPQTDSC